LTTATSNQVIPLARASTMRILDPVGMEIVCTRGSVWVTLDDILYDVILIAGTAEDTFVTRIRRSALVYALDDAQVVLVARTDSKAQRHTAQPSARSDPCAKMLCAAPA
jgi:hypothetical protein